MTKERKQLIITGFLVIILVAAGLNSYLSIVRDERKRQPPPPSPEQKPQAQAATPASRPSQEAADRSKLAAQKARGNAQWGRDPFGASPVNHEERLDNFSLQGITLGNGTGYAFINDAIVRKGGRIGDYLVADISRDRVLLQRGEQKFYLKFPAEKK